MADITRFRMNARGVPTHPVKLGEGQASARWFRRPDGGGDTVCIYVETPEGTNGTVYRVNLLNDEAQRILDRLAAALGYTLTSGRN